MPKVKIVLSEYDYGDDSYSCATMKEGISDWEEISDADLQLLKTHRHYIIGNTGSLAPVILVQDEVPVKVRIEGIKKLLEKYRVVEEERKAKELKAKQERALKKQAKTEKQQRELFEQLKQKFEEPK